MSFVGHWSFEYNLTPYQSETKTSANHVEILKVLSEEILLRLHLGALVSNRFCTSNACVFVGPSFVAVI
eukprot:m.149211 g.149211  ORF g.149211 m.149211 type:complete len:69 (-) comp14228_c0_seq1:831-1037(-)